MSNYVLEVENLHTYFKTDNGVVKAVNGVSFKLKQGEILGIVGESGCGKSVTSLSLMKLVPSPPGKIVEGSIKYKGHDLIKYSEKDMQKIRGKDISMIFQDPMTSLNPFLRVSTQMIEAIMLHQKTDKEAAKKRAIDMLSQVGIPAPEKRIDSYPHQFSGGMRQRVMIAMALSCDPHILIADEPTTALDVTIQAQILELIKELSSKFGTSVIMITHDLGVVAGMCDRVNVMYAGKIVEHSPTYELFEKPAHPYTEALISAVPRLDRPSEERLNSIPGQPPNLINLPDCCPFYPRCPKVMDICKKQSPPEFKIAEDRTVRCWLHKDKGEENNG
ncbi:ABC transporter ATP-binding protein [Spirochaetia bacterium 38H-sp]|uniref:ABC transporter ATP-binding protein n=1 Tax=Rarispira pelagica TaxID=3141764 RepID=A0ABU9UBL5_9SPIR